MIDGQAIDSVSPSVLDVFRAWLDSPVPKLGGHTPRQAVRDAGGRRDVHLLLKQMEHRHARKPINGFDPVQLRRELGLDELGQPMESRVPHALHSKLTAAGLVS